MKIRKNIYLILKESYRWRNRNLLEKEGFIEPKLTISKFFVSNWVIFLIGIFFSLRFNSFFNSDFAGYAITALSIFIGLFMSVLILVFDKFINNSNLKGIENASSSLKLNIKRTKNFSKQFVFISLEGLIIAICIIILFLIPLMFGDDFTTCIMDYRFDFKNINLETISQFIKNSIIIITRILLVILLYKFFKYLFVIFGFLGSYMQGVFNQNVKI